VDDNYRIGVVNHHHHHHHYHHKTRIRPYMENQHTRGEGEWGSQTNRQEAEKV
jgi:hypothetical protein